MALVFKKAMMKEYEMTYLDNMKYFLGMQVQQSSHIISEEKYAKNLSNKFNMLNFKPMETPM